MSWEERMSTKAAARAEATRRASIPPGEEWRYDPTPPADPTRCTECHAWRPCHPGDPPGGPYIWWMVCGGGRRCDHGHHIGEVDLADTGERPWGV